MTAILESNWAFGLLVIALLTIIFSLGSMVKREEEAMRQMRDSDEQESESHQPALADSDSSSQVTTSTDDNKDLNNPDSP